MSVIGPRPLPPHIANRVKRSAEGVADDQEDMAVAASDSLVEDRMVAREQGGQGLGILLRQVGAPLDVGEQEADRAGRQAAGNLHRRRWRIRGTGRRGIARRLSGEQRTLGGTW